MSPKSNQSYLAYFHEAVKECTPAVAIKPERYAVDMVDYHYRDPADLQPLPSGKKYVLEMESQGKRKCHRCGDYRPLHMFYIDKSKVSSFNPCGYDSYCKACRRDRVRRR